MEALQKRGEGSHDSVGVKTQQQFGRGVVSGAVHDETARGGGWEEGKIGEAGDDFVSRLGDGECAHKPEDSTSVVVLVAVVVKGKEVQPTDARHRKVDHWGEDGLGSVVDDDGGGVGGEGHCKSGTVQG